MIKYISEQFGRTGVNKQRKRLNGTTTHIKSKAKRHLAVDSYTVQAL